MPCEYCQKRELSATSFLLRGVLRTIGLLGAVPGYYQPSPLRDWIGVRHAFSFPESHALLRVARGCGIVCYEKNQMWCGGNTVSTDVFGARASLLFGPGSQAQAS